LFKDKLSNKDHRLKAWQIYLEGDSTKRTQSECSIKLQQIDKQSMNSIRKKLKNLNKIHKNNSQLDFEIINEECNCSSKLNKKHQKSKQKYGGNLNTQDKVIKKEFIEKLTSV
jgi:hypothetical protein